MACARIVPHRDSASFSGPRTRAVLLLLGVESTARKPLRANPAEVHHPGVSWIYGLSGTDDKFGVRDNGAGQIWTETKKVGSINYRTGEVVVAKEYVPVDYCSGGSIR